jgi:hypothetical protein
LCGGNSVVITCFSRVAITSSLIVTVTDFSTVAVAVVTCFSVLVIGIVVVAVVVGTSEAKALCQKSGESNMVGRARWVSVTSLVAVRLANFWKRVSVTVRVFVVVTVAVGLKRKRPIVHFIA